jgi:multicomponent K+:H+ antiporter subunit E
MTTAPSTQNHWLPYPLLTLALSALWLLLNSSMHPAHLLLAALLGVLIPLALAPVLPRLPRPHAPLTQLRLLLRFVADVVLANIAVARLILGPQKALRSGYLWVPLTATEPLVLSLLAAMVTMTPGTVAARLSNDRRFLLVHALDCSDPDTLIADICHRYETPLRAIFEERT